MKTIAFFVASVDPNEYPFGVRDIYYYSYQEYLLAMKRAGADVYFVTDNDSYLGGGRFSQAWTIDDISEVADFTKLGEIKADLVFDKDNFLGTDITVVNDLKLRPLFKSKIACYEQFGKYQPRSVVCKNAVEVQAAIADMPGDMVVIKNPFGNGGKKVYIGKKSELTVPAAETYPLLVQEFLDMSDGVPGIAKGVHDVRVLLTGSKIIGATVRQPEPGKFHANVSQGATESFLSTNQIPAELRHMATEIDSQLADLPRYYAIDFAKGKQGWRLIELNNQPGLFRESWGPLAREFTNSLAKYLMELLP